MASVFLSPRLTLVRQIGRGAMGEIWLAEDSVLACQVAVKLVAGHLRLDARTLERFQQEARGAAKVSSPHIVRVLDHGVVEGRPYIVMELLQGEDLRAHLQRVGLLAPGECARIITQACRGLASVHAAGLVHRDVKPDNMFLVDNGGESFVKLLDFGLAAEVRARFAAATGGSIVGTPCYMSPEHTEGMRALVAQSDMWSLAVVAYEALTGELPFEGEGLIGLAIAIAEARFVPPSTHRPGLPRALDEFFLRAFAPEPSGRFESATAMAGAFTRAVGLGSDESMAMAATVIAPAAELAPERRRPRASSPPPPSRRVPLVVAGVSALVVVGVILRLTWSDAPAASEPATGASPPASVAVSVATVTATTAPPTASAPLPSAPVESASLARVATSSPPPPPPSRGVTGAARSPASASAARPIASGPVISLPPSARPADTGVVPSPRRERGF